MSHAQAQRAVLIVQHTGQAFPLVQESTTIGRREENTIVLADPQVSDDHALVAWQPETGTYAIEDLGSTGGTFINDARLRRPRVLRHGDRVKMGNTIMKVRMEPSPGPVPSSPTHPSLHLDESKGSSRRWMLAGIVTALLAAIAIACVAVVAILLLTRSTGTPEVVIQSPAKGAQIEASSEIILRATASGAKDIVHLELRVSGTLIGTAEDAEGTSSLTVSKPWVFASPGTHLISAEAVTASGKKSQPASIEVTVLTSVDAGTGTPTPTPELTATPTATPEPTATPTPTTPPPPSVEYFQVSPVSIQAGGCATLQWGRVSNATEAMIEPDIGGVGTPGQQTVCPSETTTFILTAVGPSGTTRASATLTVLGGLPDLTVNSVTFVPSVPVAGQDNQVQISIRNVGIGAAPAFNWDWRADFDASFSGRVQGLEAGGTAAVVVIWNPVGPHDGLSTEARVDTDGEVVETDKGNNSHTVVVEVAEAVPEPATVILTSEGELDGYHLNDGSGSTADDILVGNGELMEGFGELVARGFMSFDLSRLPVGAAIQDVELRFYQREIHGDPYGKLGGLVLNHIYFGSSFEPSAYDTPAFDALTLGMQASPGSWYSFSGPTMVAWAESGLAAGRSFLQLRLQFGQEVDGDGQEDWIAIGAGNGLSRPLESPQLIITYLP
jgi:hypothetical protein